MILLRAICQRGRLRWLLVCAALCVLGSPASALASKAPTIALRPSFGELTFERPVGMVFAPGEDSAPYVVEQAGLVYRVVKVRGKYSKVRVLNISRRVSRRNNEEGLLGLAFHPRYSSNGFVYVYYSASWPRRSVLARFARKSGPGAAIDASSQKVILEVDQPFGNHNGATVLFGPDGYLYVSLGDGGAAGDPLGHGQNLASLLGSVIRIDVNTTGGLAYAIPRDNPFVGVAGARPEIWAYGLRNVWRMSFDKETGLLWAGDVGQGEWEEIDVISKGRNYGWNIREGAHYYRRLGRKPGSGRALRLEEPVFEYSHTEGQSVTGGYVYRGSKIPELRGAYVFGDYVSGTLWAIRYEGGRVSEHRVLLEQPRNIASFAEDPAGEIFALCFDGRIYAVVPGR